MHVEAKKEASKRPWVAGRPPSSAPRSVRSLGDVRGEEGGGKAGSGREERHEERAGEKEEARQ